MDGKVMTAAHVVQTADEIKVEFSDGKKVPARVVASSPSADVALLQIENVPIKAIPAHLGDSEKVSVGDPVFVVGAPYGMGHNLSSGIISAQHTPGGVFSSFSAAEFFQTDAVVNQGNSGGPMFNFSGEVIGLASHILSKSGGFEGIGFAVTSNTASKLLLEERTFWSGVEFILLSGELSKVFNLPQKAGAMVQRVAKGSPAEKAGIIGGRLPVTISENTFLVEGDIILSVDGILLEGLESFKGIGKVLNSKKIGEVFQVKIFRAGKKMVLTVKRLD